MKNIFNLKRLKINKLPIILLAIVLNLLAFWPIVWNIVKIIINFFK